MIREKSFTLIELALVIGIMVILVGLAFPFFRAFQKESDLNNSAEGIISLLRLSQNKTLASEGASQYGVYFDNATTPHRYILFKGDDYASRDSSFDEIRKLPPSVEIYEINLTGGVPQVVFDRVSGTTSQSGSVSIRLKDSPEKTKTISIDSAGRVMLGSESGSFDVPTQTDSRHVHFNYSGNARNALVLKLIFPDYQADNLDISFQNYLNPDRTEFYWEGNVSVGPAGNKTEQRLKIHTHSLTDFLAQFSVHRDRRFNDKALSITLDIVNLINYTANGDVSRGNPIYVSSPEFQ